MGRDLTGDNNTCMERECTLAVNGKSFESGGAFIGINKQTGKHGGCVYGDCSNDPSEVTNWHGDVRVPAKYGKIFRGNMGDKRRHVWFTWKGMRFMGLWSSIDSTELIRVREIV